MAEDYIWFETACIDWGGGPRYMCNVAKFLKAKGHSVSFVMFCFNPKLKDFYEDIDIHSLEEADSLEAQSSLNSNSFRFLKFFARIFWLRKQLKKYPDAKILTTGQWESSLWVFLASLGLRRHIISYVYGSIFTFSNENDISKFSLQMRGAYKSISQKYLPYAHFSFSEYKKLPFQKKIKNELIFGLRKRSLKRSEKIFALTPTVSTEVEQMYRVKCTTLPLVFVDDVLIEKSVKNRREKYFAVFGRLIRSKRNDRVLQSFSKIAKENNNVKLKIIGIGPEMKNLMEYVRVLELVDQVEFLGFVSDEEKRALVHGAIATFCYDIADFNLTILESLVEGTPVILSDVFDFPNELYKAKALITESNFENWLNTQDFSDNSVDWEKVSNIINSNYGFEQNYIQLIR